MISKKNLVEVYEKLLDVEKYMRKQKIVKINEITKSIEILEYENPIFGEPVNNSDRLERR